MKFKTFKPYGKRVVIKLDSTKEMTEGGIIIPESAQRPSNTAVVVSIGDKCEKAIVGSHILIPQDVGVEITIGDDTLFMINEDMIDGELN